MLINYAVCGLSGMYGVVSLKTLYAMHAKSFKKCEDDHISYKKFVGD